MKENKLGIYLTSFTDQDWTLYYNFSKGLYSDKSDYQLVINYLKKNKTKLDLELMDAENLRKKIRPTADKHVFANAVTKLCKYIEQYFTWVEVEHDPMIKDTLLLQALGKRGLSTQFFKHKEKSKERRKKMPLGLWNDYHNFMAEYNLYYCNMTSDIGVSKVSLEEAFLELKKFIHILNGYLGVEMHNRTTLLNEDWTELSNSINNEKIQTIAIRDVFDHLMNLKENKEVNSFNFLKSELFDNQLSKELRYTILIHLTSFINGEIVRGNIQDGKEILQLYQYGLEKNLLFPTGLIPLLRYINIINIACSVQEYIWATNFVDNYSKQVGTSNQIENKLLGYAQIEFSKSNFESVVELLRNTKYKYFEVETRARWFLLSVNYEINKDDSYIIDYYVQSFINFLKRNKLKTTKLTPTAMINSANYLALITKTSNLSKILDLIKNEKTVYYRKWLISKAKEKMGKNKGAIN